MKTYMVYTEDMNREKVKEIVAREFDCFTLLSGLGYWVGKCTPHRIYDERSLIIVILTDEREKIELVAGEIKGINDQESVMVTSFETEMEMI